MVAKTKVSYFIINFSYSMGKHIERLERFLIFILERFVVG
jgi:hypothetical protein